MAKSDLRIDILGTEITISTDEQPEYLFKLLNKYRQTIENVQRISGLKDPLKIAVLTGFLLSDDLEKAGAAVPGEKNENGEAEKLTLSMINRLDEVVSGPGQSAPAEPTEIAPDSFSDAANKSFYKLSAAVVACKKCAEHVF